MMIKKILIANRGEIACRIIKTCKRMGLETLAVFSEADRGAQHAKLADKAFCIGPGEAKLSYLNIEKIVELARHEEIDAIHPGYGFLSENSLFASKLEKEGVVFVGPPANVIDLLGDKIKAKELAVKSKIPTLPSLELAAREDDPKNLKAAEQFATENPLPLLIKAAAGGGGKGMRIVADLDELEPALQSASREAQAFFNDGRIFIERLIQPCRHIEVQIFADKHGKVIHLYDRDCSFQRKHQKLVEEAPAPNLSDSTRSALYSAAVSLAQSCKYVGAGTVEFLLDSDHNFYFLEVNSRLQVEHPVTEAITGLDLVELQVRIANGESLDEILPEAPKVSGHAIECRICAESPSKDFAPASGKLEKLELASLNKFSDARLDFGYTSGDYISHYYDSLIGKLICSDTTRQAALTSLKSNLENLCICGIDSNIEFLRELIYSKEFAEVSHHTTLAEQVLSNDLKQCKNKALSAVCFMLTCGRIGNSVGKSSENDSWVNNPGWTITGNRQISAEIVIGASEFLVKALLQDQTLGVTVEDLKTSDFNTQEFNLSNPKFDGVHLSFKLNGELFLARLFSLGSGVWVHTKFGCHQVKLKQHSLDKSGSGTGQNQGEIRSTLPGKILSVLVKPGQEVKQGEGLLVIESMKMEHKIVAPLSGKVKEILVESDKLIESDEGLVVLEG